MKIFVKRCNRFQSQNICVFVALGLLLLLPACSRVAGDLSLTPPPTPTAMPSATAVPAPSATPPPPTAGAQAKASATASAPATGTPNPNQKMQKVKIVLVALNDNGKSGRAIGCNDSAVAVDADVPESPKPIGAALGRLLELRGTGYGQSGLYNALGNSQLRVAETDNVNGRVIVKLAGELQLGGVCDGPRAVAQIQDTVTQFGWSKNAVITVNGAPLETIASGR